MHNFGSLQNCNPSDPRDLQRRAIEIFRKNVDPESEYLEEEIHSLKRQVLKDFIVRKGKLWVQSGDLSTANQRAQS
mgnify:CR=1 FL=1